MRFRELFENRNSMPHLYLDMDGVQADFFGHWARAHGVKHYKAIPHFEGAIEELADSTARKVYDFFKDLEPLSGGQKIINWIKYYNIPYTVLSAPLRGKHAEASVRGKKAWLDIWYPGSSGTSLYTNDKHQYAVTNGVPNVLVDDYGKYLDAWHNAGGIAIKHDEDDPDATLAALIATYKDFI